MNALASYPVIHQQTVAWGDMDAFGHVNNVQYYRYMESARISYLNALNIFFGSGKTWCPDRYCARTKSVNLIK